jgi:hypothetical protein
MKSVRFFLALMATAATLAVTFTLAVPSAQAQGPENTAGNSSEQQAIVIPPSCQLVNEALQVQDAINRFNNALASRDTQQLLASGIEPASVKGWQRFFRDNPRATVTDRCSGNDLSIAGDTANWSCSEMSTIVSDGRPVQYAHNIRFTFTRKNGSWSISDRR